MLNGKSLKKNILFFYIVNFLFDLFRSLFFGIGSLFYTEEINLKVHHIFIIKLFTPIIIALFEIPSGVIGDRISRKLNFIISCAFCSLGFLCYYLSNNLIDCIVSEIFYSIGIAFHTGSLDALIISQMKEHNISINSLLSKSFLIRNISSIIGGSIGIIISYKSMRLFWVLGSLGMILTALVNIWFIEEEKRKYIKNEKQSRFSYKIIINRKFITLTIINISLSLINAPFFNYWHTFIVRELNIPRSSKEYIIIYFLYNFLISLGSITAPIFNNKLGRVKTLFLSIYIIIIPTIIMVTTKSKSLSILMFLATEFARGVESSTFFNLYNSIISNENRSLLLSINSMLQRIISIISLIFFSYLSKERIEGRDIILYSSIMSLILVNINLFCMKEKDFLKRNV